MKLVFLGTGGYHPNEIRHTAGLFLPELGLLLDAGTGTFRLSGYLERDELFVALSHAHLDHVCGLTYLLVPLHRGQIRSMKVLASAEVLQAVREHLFSDPLFPVLPTYESVPLDEVTAVSLPGGATLTHRTLTQHPGGSRAYRIDWPAGSGQSAGSIAYLTDTIADPDVIDFVRGVDLLVHECYFSDDLADWAMKTGHSHTSQVARFARDARVGRLVLTHLDPQCVSDDPVGLDTARQIFPQTDLARDLLELTVP